VLVATNQSWNRIDPSRFHGGEEAVAGILDAVGTERIVPESVAERQLEDAARRLSRPVLPRALSLVAGFLAVDERVEFLADAAPTRGSDALLILTNQRLILVLWRGITIKRVNEILYADIDTVGRSRMGDAMVVDIAGRKAIITLDSHAE